MATIKRKITIKMGNEKSERIFYDHKKNVPEKSKVSEKSSSKNIESPSKESRHSTANYSKEMSKSSSSKSSKDASKPSSKYSKDKPKTKQVEEVTKQRDNNEKRLSEKSKEKERSSGSRSSSEKTKEKERSSGSKSSSKNKETAPKSSSSKNQKDDPKPASSKNSKEAPKSKHVEAPSNKRTLSENSESPNPKRKRVSNEQILKELILFKELLANHKQPKVIYVCPPKTPLINECSYSNCNMSQSYTEINNSNKSSAHVIEASEKSIKMFITEKVLEEHPKFLPPLSEERRKLHLKRLNSTSSFKTTSNLTIVDISSGCSQIKIEPDDIKPTIPEDLSVISGLQLEDEPKGLYVNALSLNLFIGKVAQGHFKKKGDCFRAMKSDGGMWAFFKCMGIECAYFTSKKKNFIEHLKSHEKNDIGINDFFRNCPYCFWKSKNAKGLIEHLETTHKHCRYQCSECFYRSAEPQSVFDHCQQFHGKSKILECESVPILKKLDNDEIEKYSERIAKTMTVSCKVCHKDFSSYKDCLAHLQSHLREKCDESQKMSANKQIKSSNYREMINELGIYCCIYCRRGSHNNADSQIFACNRRTEIRDHMQKHPNKLHYCADSSNNFKIMRLAARKDLHEKTIKFEGDLEMLANNKDVLKTQY